MRPCDVREARAQSSKVSLDSARGAALCEPTEFDSLDPIYLSRVCRIQEKRAREWSTV